MKRIGLFEAKTNHSKIAEEVKRTGQAVTLTKRGEPYVDLAPHKETAPARRSNASIFEELEAVGRRLPKSGMKQIKLEIEEGRR